jgi:hypothetical protein
MSKWLSVFGVAPCILAALLIFDPAGFAQNKKKGEDLMRTVQGTVTSAGDAGAPVVGAVVYLKNLKNLQIRSFITQQNGTYYFHGLSTDVDYEVRAKSHDMESGARTLSSFDSRTDAVLNLKLDKKVEKK